MAPIIGSEKMIPSAIAANQAAQNNTDSFQSNGRYSSISNTSL